MVKFDSQVQQMAGEECHRLKKRYHEALGSLPPAGHGHGLHGRLLGVANVGVKAGIAPASIVSDLRNHIPRGDRVVSDSEIRQAVERAVRDGGGPLEPAASALTSVQPRYRRDLRDCLIDAGNGWDEERIVSASPIEIPDEVGDHGRVLLTSLYAAHEHLFIGERYDRVVRTVENWLALQQGGVILGPNIIANPLTGQEAETKSGKLSMRCDACVADYRYAIVEFDDLDAQSQCAFWASINLPIVALIYSGGKSLHAWIRVDCADREAWEQDVEMGLYAERLIPLGVDPMCRTEARLSRMPGFKRDETGRWQRLIYLAPEGRRVSQ